MKHDYGLESDYGTFMKNKNSFLDSWSSQIKNIQEENRLC